MTDEVFPDEIYAAALAGLPGMTPPRLAGLLDVMDPPMIWAHLTPPHPQTPRFRSPVLDELAVAAGLDSADLVKGWCDVVVGDQAEVVARNLSRVGVGVVLRGRDGYPARLEEDPGAPPVLFQRGRPFDPGPTVAIVGTDRCTSPGRGIAFGLAADLTAAGVTVLAGFESGIGRGAQLGTLSACLNQHGVPPVAVAVTGLDRPYPMRCRDEWDRMAEIGTVFSEAPLGAGPEPWRYPYHARLVAALADAVVIVEADTRPDIVDEARSRDVPVLAVPGSVRSAASQATNELLVNGTAAAARDAADVLNALNLT